LPEVPQDNPVEPLLRPIMSETPAIFICAPAGAALLTMARAASEICAIGTKLLIVS
jgi:hypothetical protein